MSFGQSLLNLHVKYFVFSRLDVGMMCYLIRFDMPHIQFLFVSTPRKLSGLQSRLPARKNEFFHSGGLQCMGHPKPPCDLLMLQDVTPAHKGLAPFGLSLNFIYSKNFYYICHSGHTHCIKGIKTPFILNVRRNAKTKFYKNLF